jgi:type II secretory pathway pseudopilin PulG
MKIAPGGNQCRVHAKTMLGSVIHLKQRYWPVGLLAIAIAALLVSPAAPQSSQPADALAQQPELAAAVAQYRRALEEYNRAWQSYTAVSSAYWNQISEKRQLRNAKRARGETLSISDYVLTQPPVYTGPPRPQNPLKPEVKPPRIYVPVVADFVAAAHQEFKFVPRFPQSETEFKRGYAKIALAAGLTRDQIVRIYGFEATGNGSYDIEAGLEYNKHGRAITTALGYNQLLATNSVEILAEKGDELIRQVQSKSALASGAEHQPVDGKIDILRKMVAFARSVPDAWGQHEILANTPKGLAVHALNLDLDVGPMLQTQKLLDSIVFARRKGFSRSLTAAELEMMNLTGDGNGFDMVTMPLSWRDQVPTANFFRPSGYADNPVAQRNNVVAKLIAATDARMDEEIKKPGARELAAYLQ